MGKIGIRVQIGVFLVFIGVFFVLNIIMPDKEFSEQENRYLTGKPEFSVAGFFLGSYTTEYEKYMTDQFVMRDNWIAIKTATELAVGKTENNNIYFCRDGSLIERFKIADKELVRKNIEAINELSRNSEVPVYFGLIPGAVKIFEYKLPRNATNCDQKELIDSIYSEIDAVTIDLYSILERHKEEYIYFRTDHHWTSLGAYYGYRATMEAMGIGAVEPERMKEPEQVTDEFYGTYYSASGARWTKADRIEIYVPEEKVRVYKNAVGQEEIQGRLYEYARLEEKDKYTMFLGGNTPIVRLETELEEGAKILMIRDSYADIEVPFFLSHFSEIHMIDLRYYKYSLSEYISENGFDAILVSYSVSNFVSDNYIFMAAN